MSKNKKPEVLHISHDEVEALKQRVIDSPLSQSDQTILLHIMSLYFWVQTKLSRAELTMLRLKRIFGMPTEKKKIVENETACGDEATQGNDEIPAAPPDTSESADDATSPGSTAPTVKKRARKINPNANHGRMSHHDYTGCPVIPISHENLKAGDACPSCQETLLNGRLVQEKPCVVVQLTGAPLIAGERYAQERLRCSLCKEYFVAPLPACVASRGKYDASCRTNIAIARYYAGLPFHRIEQLQASQGIPLPDATQWDLTVELYEVAQLPYNVLLEQAADGSLVYYDDTGNRILEAYAAKKAVHTTAFISESGDKPIYLFFTGLPCAGENLDELLKKRTTKQPLITMSDASSHNIPKSLSSDLAARWILCFCLVHGRRKFHELQQFYGKECKFVLGIISQVYRHETHCKKNQYSPEERLRYHQTQSTPLMDTLRVWLNNQLLHRLLEPNSPLGQAVRYMLRHWAALTRFLHVPGAPIDNSLCEQAIKVAIRHRRNSLFYKTIKGAAVGDCLMSLLHTAAKNKVNIYDYLNALQIYAKEVAKEPSQWLPWNYQATLARLTDKTPKAA
jgi:transposase